MPATDKLQSLKLQSLDSLTVLNARVALEHGLEAIRAGQTVIDLGPVKAVDSAAVAVLLGWQRAARTAGVVLKFSNLPPNLKILTALYGVDALLGDAPAAGEVMAGVSPRHH